MSSLQRYKKSGGFYQLLSLIETFGPQKREKFLEMIDGESAPWAAAIRDKMLSLDRIFAWPDQVLVEVFKRLPVKSQAFALQGMKDEHKAKIMQFYSSSEQRRLDDVLDEGKPKPEEIQATLLKLVELARKMIHERELNPEKFDAGLVIPEDIESKLESQNNAIPRERRFEAAPVEMPATAHPSHAQTEGTGGVSPEMFQLQRTLAALLKENKMLKDEVRSLQSRLDQIKKMVA